MTDFSPAQLKAVIAIAIVGLTVSTFRLIDIHSAEAIIDPDSFACKRELSDQESPQIIFDLNTVPADSLELIPGIGPVLAQRIVAFRDSAGPFEKMEDLIKIRGIGPKNLETIGRYLRVGRW